MGIHLLPFVGVSLLLVIAPGPDTVLVTKNALLYGRRLALGTVAGISLGLLVWTAAAALGVAAVLRESEVAFTVLKVVGATYLVWLGIGALRTARSQTAGAFSLGEPAAEPPRPAQGFRQGLLCNLGNPKIAIFFTSLLPQFVSAHRPELVPFLVLGAVFALLGLTWLCCYALLATRLSALLRSPRMKTALDTFTGLVLIGVGIRLALEPR